MNDTTSLEYGSSGQVAKITVNVDETLTYQESKNVYRITGTIVVDNATGTVHYDIEATGGLFGDTPQTCKK